MAKTNTQPATKKVVITLEIGEPKKGQRALVISGAPAGEMPLIKAGTFAERHVLLDQMWAELLRRPDQTPKITEPKTSKVKEIPPGTDAKPETNDETESAEDDTGAEPATEQPAVSGAPEVESDQLVVTPAVEPPADLPAIENDLTATPASALEAAIVAAKEETANG